MPRRKHAEHGTTSMYQKGCRCEPCRSVLRAYKKAYYHRYPDRARAYGLRKTYGITQTDFERMFIAQEGLCGICGRVMGDKHFDVDHDHTTLQVRGLLCRNCNRSLGWYEGVKDGLLLYLERAANGKD